MNYKPQHLFTNHGNVQTKTGGVYIHICLI
jgi:hypothetical protein